LENDLLEEIGQSRYTKSSLEHLCGVVKGSRREERDDRVYAGVVGRTL